MMISEFFERTGFEPTASEYATFNRAPVYESTDWNYVRFDCAYFMYELVNGELRFYRC